MGNGKLAPRLFEELPELPFGLLTLVSYSMVSSCVSIL